MSKYVSIFVQILRAKDEIRNMKSLPTLPKTTTPFNEIIEDILVHNEELEKWNMSNN